MGALPIDSALDDITRALREHRNAVIVAPPGAGKTTRVPPAILAAELAGDGDIVVLQPRRLAARMAAQRVASERGEAVGRTIGYEIRFDRKLSCDTRIRFVTEGVLVRQLVAEAQLRRTGVVVIDEFHERHLAGDVALSLLRKLQRHARPELRIAVMSATLDPGPACQFLGDCPVIQTRGRQFPVAVDYLPPSRDGGREQPLGKRVSSALWRLRRDGAGGDVLVFLPGAAEIRRAMAACQEQAERGDLLLVALHGDMPAVEQDRAVAPSKRQKVIFSTNVAETSITIEGVACVIDSGLARVARHSPWSGIPTLRVEPISQASAAQRAGRAGRTRPGRCLRLYSQHDHDTRRPFDTPEVARADLADAALALHAWGVPSLSEFAWFERPPEAAIDAADELLARLGAIDECGAVTECGRRMLRFPLHPRQGRMLVEAEARGVARRGCILAALVGQRDLRTARLAGGRAAACGPSDLLDELELVAEPGQAGLDRAAASAVKRSAQKLQRLVRQQSGDKTPSEQDEALLLATLAGYPDRVARRRRPGSPEIVLAGGGSAVLSPASVVAEAEFLVAIEIEERSRRTAGSGGKTAVVRRASAVDPSWLLDLYIDRICDSDELWWNPERDRVERVSRMTYDGLVIDETRDPGAARREPEQAAQVLASAALANGIERFIDRFIDRGELESWRARLRFVRDLPGSGDIAPPTDDDLRTCVHRACLGLVSFAELERAPIMTAVRGMLSAEQQAFVARMAPSFVSLPGRRRVPVRYEIDRPPWIASRLQDFFGLTEGPTVAAGSVPLVLHLLAPNRRAVQVTSDLAGFWARHYPGLRRQLMRRYSRHAWPENPGSAQPK